MFGPQAYARALRPLLPQAAGYALALLRNRQDAEDAVQTASLRGLERLSSYDSRRPFKGWWFAILRNGCIDTLRKARSVRVEPLGDHDPPAPASEPTEDWERLDDGIRRITEAHREILRLRYFGGLSYAELAEALAIPQGTVMSRLHLARKALAAKLQEES